MRKQTFNATVTTLFGCFGCSALLVGVYVWLGLGPGLVTVGILGLIVYIIRTWANVLGEAKTKEK